MTRRELISSFLLAWGGRSISEFGSIVILAYYIINPPFFDYVYPLPTLIWYSYEVYGLPPLALGYASASLIISIIIIVLIELISGGGRTRLKLW